MDDRETAHELDPKLLEILVCPQSKARLVYDRAASELKCKKSRLAYPIRDGIPIMLPDEAREMPDAEVNALA
ncbi:MAG: Trm112 family protein [Parvularculaceae bacterium]